MASGNQDMNGNWADFPMAPINKAMPIHVGAISKAIGSMAEKYVVWKWELKLMSPKIKAISANRLIKNAFLAARMASGF